MEKIFDTFDWNGSKHEREKNGTIFIVIVNECQWYIKLSFVVCMYVFLYLMFYFIVIAALDLYLHSLEVWCSLI